MLILSGDGDEITLKMDLMTMNSFVKHEASKSDDSWSPQYRCCYAAPQTIQTQTIFLLGIPMFHTAPHARLLPTPTDLFIESLSALSAPSRVILQNLQSVIGCM